MIILILKVAILKSNIGCGLIVNNLCIKVFIDNSKKICYKCIYQIMPKRTYQPKKRKRKRTHGFLKRASAPGGRNVIKRRRQKQRKKLAV